MSKYLLPVLVSVVTNTPQSDATSPSCGKMKEFYPRYFHNSVLLFPLKYDLFGKNDCKTRNFLGFKIVSVISSRLLLR
jgi:hypothetical protein